MNKDQRRAFPKRLVAHWRLREDLLDAALIEGRKDEPARALEQVLAGPQRGKSGRGR